ncbi:expressed unknown protein [Seminavis robusta]|uniref:Uncharacterized protein n=1 Tax=Seminavis robusta TaxID=568900 RepID=A0A9N8DTP6_9STRA|nr:expressed unknown protein [Seminavis robusta]|eukprot:Sro271_g104690.1 n/a (294) ;mRNA; r:71929-72810
MIARTTIISLLAVVAAVVVVDGAGCHGNSRFRLAPMTKGASTTEEKQKQGMASIDEKAAYCQDEFGEDATLMDLRLMEGEFPNAQDLQHALNPLFEEDPLAVYYITDHGEDTMKDALNHHDHGYDDHVFKYILAKEEDHTANAHWNPQRVAGQVFLETRPVNVTAALANAHILCYIAKPKYTTITKVASTRSSPMGSNSNFKEMEYMPMMEEESSSSSSSGGGNRFVSFLAVVAVGAIAMAAIQTYKARQASNMMQANPFAAQPSDFGGSYRILSTNGNHDLTQQLNNDLELA